MVARFLREARAVNMIRHPNIIDIYEFGELPEGRPFYVMELLAGTDLRTLLAERGRFPPAEVLEILEPVCSALEAAHAQGIVHRDLKASNIQVIEEGERRTVKLLDFGIAKLIHPDAAEAGLTVVGTRLGTSYTMAPEQIRGGTIDGRTDVYALGVVLHQLVTGHYPFRADQMTEIERLHLEAPPPRPSQLAPVPPALDAVVLRAMEKAPDRRFPGVRAFIEALADAVGARSRHAGPEGATEGTVARAVAIYVDVRMAEIPDGAGDDILDDVSLVLDLVEQQLRHRGWLMPLQTGNALLGAKVLPADAAAAIAATAEALAAAEALAGEIRGRPSAHPDVHVNVCFHVDNALVTDSSEAPGGKEIVGGDLTAIAAWAPQENVPGLHVTAAAGLG
jgi:serine/threonine-protein kinase